MHPWNGKTKQERKEHIEKLLLKFKKGQIANEKLKNEKLLTEFENSKVVPRTDGMKAQIRKSAGRNHQTSVKRDESASAAVGRHKRD